jgi:NitT/TauT family transport system substrate-binding protein
VNSARAGRIPAALISLCLATGAAAGETLRVGLIRTPTAGPLYIAQAQGYFEAEGLDLLLRFYGTDSEATEAVAAGKLDIGAAELTGSFYAFAAAHRLKIIASQASDQTGFAINTLLISRKAHQGGFTGVRDLPGKRIGIADTDAAARYSLAAAAVRFGMDPGSMKLLPLRGRAGELSSLDRGDIDAALLPLRPALQGLRRGGALLRLSDLAVSEQRVVFTSAATIAARRPLVEKFMHAYQRGAAEYHLNFLQYDDGGDFIPGPNYPRYAELIAREARVAPRELSSATTYCDRRANLDAADLDRQLKFWKDHGKLDRRVAAAELLDLSLIGEEAGPSQ